MSDTVIETITSHMGSDGKFCITCPLCGKSRIIDPPARATRIKLNHCEKTFLIQLNRRKAFRKKCNENGIMEIDGRRFGVTIKDLSLGGICFETPNKINLSVGDKLRLVNFFLIKNDLLNPIQMKITRTQSNVYSAEFQNFLDGASAKKAIYTWLRK